MAIHRQTLSKRFSDYRRNASTRGLVFNLDKEQFNAITQETCCYCGAEDYIGVDRIDSGKGYTEANIQPF